MKKLLLGNEAIALGAYEAGVTVATAYPGTPSTEITENIAKYENIYAEWSPNEKVALEVAIGASIAGARSICSMKHVGLNVAADPLFTVSYTGINAGLVIIVADDPGMHSSQNEQDSRFYAKANQIPMLEPSDSSECRDFVIKAFELSENYDCPVIIRITTRVAHSRSKVEIGERNDFKTKDYAKNIDKYVMMPAMGRKRHLEVEKRIEYLNEYAHKTDLNKFILANRDIGIITSGISYQYMKEAHEDASYLKLGMVYPISEKLVKVFCKEVKKIYVIEELEPFIEDEIKKSGINVIGKEIFPRIGELSSSKIKEKLFNEPEEKQVLINISAPARPPVMCCGCPHRGMFYVLKKLGLTVSGDIGCYTLGALPPNNSLDTCICMGASIGVVHGMEKARGKSFSKKAVAVIGDSTFIHSGITGLIDIVYNKGTSTVIIADNSTTGMTGHQQNPATGLTLKNEPTKKLDFVALVKAIGINRVKVVDPFDMKQFEKVLKEELEVNEPSVIISARPCALLKTVKAGIPLSINTEKCKKCKLCINLGCPAIVDRGDFIEINANLCTGCNLCVDVCNFNAIVKAGDENG